MYIPAIKLVLYFVVLGLESKVGNFQVRMSHTATCILYYVRPVVGLVVLAADVHLASEMERIKCYI